MNLQAIHTFHKTKPGYAVFGVCELALVYLLSSLALSSGDWWEYLLTAVFGIGFLQNVGHLIVRSSK